VANAINLFDARRSDWTIPGTSKLTPEAQIFLRDLWLRAGGATGSSSNDLSVSQFEDAGIAEGHAVMFANQDEARQIPLAQESIAADEVASNEVASLRAEVDSLRQRVDALEQGQMI
jgi:hypothetical protein